MKRIFTPERPIGLVATATAVGHEESRGRFGNEFDFHDDSDRFGADTWEHAESALGGTVLSLLLKKAHRTSSEIGILFSGDLQNQCVASAEGTAFAGIPYLGLYAACSTVCEGMVLAAYALSADKENRYAAVVTTSHHCAAERQFRLPLEYGGQRPPTAQWTVTAGGGYLFSREPADARVTAVMAGRIVDAGIKDAANMGAAMAPAVCDTLLDFFRESDTAPEDYDRIVTGDLGIEGGAILRELMRNSGVSLGDRHRDCGALIYDTAKQDAHAGGSGCGCAASVFAAHYVPALREGKFRKILFLATGALMSPDSLKQGGSILGIAPLTLWEGKE